MPTGYTHTLIQEEEISFEKFALICARAFGACIDMRDDPMDKDIPDEFQVSDFHDKEIIKYEDMFNVLTSMPEHIRERECEKKYNSDMERYKESLEGLNTQRIRYQNMRAKVKEWIPPTYEHINLKDFMLEQINSSLKFDCSYMPDEPKRMSTKEWYEKEIESVLCNLKYHREQKEGEQQWVDSRNKWLKELRVSIKGR